MDILAHRANLAGPQPAVENTLPYVEAALREGYGLEIDLRRTPAGEFYIAHDAAPRSTANALESFTELFRRFADQCVALNVKELGYEFDLVELQLGRHFGNRSFLFDFELLEPGTPGRAQRLIRNHSRGAEAALASRLSDRGESLSQCLDIVAQVAWVDEFDSLWVTDREIETLHRAGRRIYAVSPELHGADTATRLRRWADFKRWKISGVCTDYALEARQFFADFIP